MKTVLIILAPEFEEIEAVTPIDILRRAGMDVTVASLHTETLVPGQNGMHLQADTTLEKALTKSRDYDALILPGGKAAFTLKDSQIVIDLVRAHHKNGALVAALCAAPIILQTAGILTEDMPRTAHFTVADILPNIDRSQPVIFLEKENILTSQGPGTALAFSLKIVETLRGEPHAKELAKGTCYNTLF